MMSEKKKDWLSALADDELQEHELQRGIEALRNDKALQQSWKAYHVIRDTVTSNLHDAVDLQLHQRISAALEAEPTLLAPKRRERPWLKQVAGVAIAASVTGLAIIGVQNLNEVDGGQAAVPVAQKQDYIRINPTVLAASKEQQQKQSDHLDSYLVNHNEYATGRGIQGVLPYVRIVGHKAE